MDTSAKPKIICLTPVKNEAWILDRFIQCASLWADHIIIADQGSTDGSVEIASRYPKVRVVHNTNTKFDENVRQRMLIDAAREIPGPKLLLALDADEFVTANWTQSPEWQSMLAAKPGTVIRFHWVQVLADFQKANYNLEEFRPYGFMDDGREHVGGKFHANRLPVPHDTASLLMRDVKLLHYVNTDTERMASKFRWYQCWELVDNPKSRPLNMYRLYHRVDKVPESEMHPFQRRWLEGYEAQGIDMTSTQRDAVFWWDKDVLRMLKEHGLKKFSKIDMWDADWERMCAQLPPGETFKVEDPRTSFEKSVHGWLASTQSYRLSAKTRFIQKLLKAAGW